MAHYPRTTNSERPLALIGKSSKNTLKRADNLLQEAMKGNFKVLKTGWSRVNKALLGGFFMGQIYLIAGASGHGKSYFLNLILRAFMSKKINNPKFKFKILHFGFEMSPEMELFRRLSSITGIPLRKLISSDDTLTEEEYERVKEAYVLLEDEPIVYFDQPGTRYQIEATIRAFHKKYPDHELIVTLDHSLLVVSETGEDEVKTLAELGKMLIQLKKDLGVCFIVLGQLNDKIESEKRRDPTNPTLHFPTKTDIHGSKQLYHAADVVMVIHQPALLNIDAYGKKRYPTENLIVLHYLKQRNGMQGYTLLRNDLEKGMIRQQKMDDDSAAEKVKRQLQITS